METKDELVNHIKMWLEIDKEIQEYQKIIREKRKLKTKLSNELIDVMKTNNIDGFDINNGKLSYNKVKRKESISKKMLLRCLNDYYKNNEEQVSEITNHILNSRQVKEVDCINIRKKK